MKYNELDSMLTGRNRSSKKLANNTYAERRGDNIAVRLHQTDVLTFEPSGRVVVTSGGWLTPTTKDRINQFLPNGIGISQQKGSWFWWSRETSSAPVSLRQPYTDGDVVLPDGTLELQRKDVKDDQKLRKSIRAYAKLCADAVPLPHPSGGDCWYCCMVVSDGADKGKSLGDATKDTSHLTSHMEEKYAVPSLVFHALKARGCSDVVIHTAFNDSGFSGVAKHHVVSAVSKYMYRQFGLVS